MTDQQSKNLNWLWKIVESVLKSHAKNANLEFFQRKYPNLPAEIIAVRLIDTAARSAGLVGFASGTVTSVAGLTAVTSAVGTVATGLIASSVTVPTLAISLPIMGAALLSEVALLIRIQLHLAYDLFVLNGLLVDIEDPEHMQEVMQVAFGIKGVEVTGQALQKIIPQFAPKILRKAMRTGLTRRKIQELVAKKLTWSFARKYFGEGVLIKALVPGIAVFTATWWDYTSTKGIGKTLHAKIRRRGLAVKEVEKLKLDQFDNPKLVMQAVLFIGLSGHDFSETELTFYSNLIGKFRDFYGNEVIDSLNKDGLLQWDDVAIDLVNIADAQKREAIYKLLVSIVVVGGKLNSQKRRRLQNLAKSYGLTFDRAGIESRCKRFEEPKPFRTCLIVILALFVLILLMCVLSSYGVFWLSSQ